MACKCQSGRTTADVGSRSRLEVQPPTPAPTPHDLVGWKECLRPPWFRIAWYTAREGLGSPTATHHPEIRVRVEFIPRFAGLTFLTGSAPLARIGNPPTTGSKKYCLSAAVQKPEGLQTKGHCAD